MSNSAEIIFENIAVLPGCREVYYGNKLIEMTGLEFNLLWLLVKSSPEVVARKSIAKHIFNRRLLAVNSSINIHISTIRKKLFVHAKYAPIKTIRGQGYLFLIF
ncbi:MAG: winged helix-turn-helix transcriptional regulator [Colwellia sp.]|nr:winged helix-turn-helix transcriptional regulator [Colwellia sp.]